MSVTKAQKLSLLVPRLLTHSNTVFRGYPLAAAAAKLPRSCPILCDPIDGSPPGSPVPGVLKARTLEWVHYFFWEISKFIERCNDSYNGHLGSHYSEWMFLNILFYLHCPPNNNNSNNRNWQIKLKSPLKTRPHSCHFSEAATNAFQSVSFLCVCVLFLCT